MQIGKIGRVIAVWDRDTFIDWVPVFRVSTWGQDIEIAFLFLKFSFIIKFWWGQNVNG